MAIYLILISQFLQYFYYAYDIIQLGENQGSALKVNQEQAKWVKQIFEWYADGHSPRWIVSTLNEIGVEPPRAGKKINRKLERQRHIWRPEGERSKLEKRTNIEIKEIDEIHKIMPIIKQSFTDILFVT